MTKRTKNSPPPLYEVEEVLVERRLFPRGRRRPDPSGDGDAANPQRQERRRSPGRRKTDRDPGSGQS